MRQSRQIDVRAFRRSRASRISLSTVAPADGAMGAEGPLRSDLAAPVPRDEAAFWLTAAAEIEHALMVQYLFAAYSLNPAAAGARVADIERVKQNLLQIAREEMGHLITVENLLLLIGAPLHLGREHSPYASEIYPFRFKLERVTLDTLAKYVMAECPDVPIDEIAGLSAEDQQLLAREIEPRAIRSNDGEAIKNVGPVYHRLHALFASGLDDSDFRLGRSAHQARWEDWGFEAQRGTSGLEVLVRSFDQPDAGAARAAAAAAIAAIGEQGEAADIGADMEESHFERFLVIFKSYAAVSVELGREPTWPVTRDPNTSRGPVEAVPPGHMVEAVLEQRRDEGRISDRRTRAWAELFNLRYRLLLGCLLHTFHRSDQLYTANGDRTPRGLLQIWTFGEMRRLKKLAEKLVQLPLNEGMVGPTAGPPFELPYSLQLPTFEEDRWRLHADVLGNAISIAQILQAGPDTGDPFLEALIQSDEIARRAALAMESAGQLPSDLQPSGYLKTLVILEEAVRGFDVAPRHAVTSVTPPAREGAFWRERSRDELLALKVLGEDVVVAGAPESSALLGRISAGQGEPARMPRHRPRIAQTRIDAVREWIAANAPDGPAGVMLRGEPSPQPEPEAPIEPPTPQAPSDGSAPPTESLSFEREIRPLFRDFDRSTMLAFGLDLHDHADVSARASDILARLEDGTMPCDGAWPPAQIDLFRRWRDGGSIA